MGFQKFLWQFVTCSYKKIFSKNLYKNMRMLICSFPSSSRHFRNRTYFANKKNKKKIKMFWYVETISKQICKPLPILVEIPQLLKNAPPLFSNLSNLNPLRRRRRRGLWSGKWIRELEPTNNRDQTQILQHFSRQFRGEKNTRQWEQRKRMHNIIWGQRNKWINKCTLRNILRRKERGNKEMQWRVNECSRSIRN